MKEGRAGNATGGRYTRVTDNGDLDDDSDFSDDDVFGGSKDGRGQNGTNGTRNSPSVEMSTRR